MSSWDSSKYVDKRIQGPKYCYWGEAGGTAGLSPGLGWELGLGK